MAARGPYLTGGFTARRDRAGAWQPAMSGSEREAAGKKVNEQLPQKVYGEESAPCKPLYRFFERSGSSGYWRGFDRHSPHWHAAMAVAQAAAEDADHRCRPSAVTAAEGQRSARGGKALRARTGGAARQQQQAREQSSAWQVQNLSAACRIGKLPIHLRLSRWRRHFWPTRWLLAQPAGEPDSFRIGMFTCKADACGFPMAGMQARIRFDVGELNLRPSITLTILRAVGALTRITPGLVEIIHEGWLLLSGKSCERCRGLPINPIWAESDRRR